MNKKILGVAAIVVVFAFGFLYLNQGYLSANDKDGKTCSKTSCDNKTTGDKTSCDDKNKKTGSTEVKAGGEWNTYQFTTDKACCEQMKTDLQNELTAIAGVKEIKFSMTCAESKMTNVTVYYSAGETSEDALAKFVKDKSYDCSGKCTKDGVKSGSSKEGGCDGKKECPSKEKKSSNSKQL